MTGGPMKILTTHILIIMTAFIASSDCNAGDHFSPSPILIMPAPTLGESSLVMPGHCPTFETERVYAVPASHNATRDSQQAAPVTTRVSATSVSEPVAEIDDVNEVLSDIPQAVPLTAGSEAVPQTSPFSLFGIGVLVVGVFVWVVKSRQ